MKCCAGIVACAIVLSISIVCRSADSGALCKITEGSFVSQKYGTVQYLVMTPPDYDSGKNGYPVLFWLHGSGGNRKAVLNCLAVMPVKIDEGKKGYFRENSIKKTSAAIENKLIPPMIIVSCDAPKGEWKSEDMDLVTGELIRFIDGNYRTIPEKRGRSIEGFSKGAEALSHIVTAHPELYSSASMLCGAWGEKRWVNSRDAITNAGTKLRITVGSDDQWLKSAEKVKAAFEKAGMPLEFDLLQGVKHNAPQVYEKKGLELLRFHSSSWKDKEGKPLFEVK